MVVLNVYDRDDIERLADERRLDESRASRRRNFNRCGVHVRDSARARAHACSLSSCISRTAQMSSAPAANGHVAQNEARRSVESSPIVAVELADVDDDARPSSASASSGDRAAQSSDAQRSGTSSGKTSIRWLRTSKSGKKRRVRFADASLDFMPFSRLQSSSGSLHVQNSAVAHFCRVAHVGRGHSLSEPRSTRFISH